MNRRLLAALTLAAIPATYYATLGRHHHARIAASHAELDAAYAEYDAATEEAARAASLQRDVDELQRWHDQLRARLRFDPVADPAVLAIRPLLQQAGLAVLQAETIGDNGRWSMPHERVRVVVTGRFGDLFAAVQQLENATPPTRVTSLNVRANADQTTVRAELEIARTGGAP
ncbi:MAG: hypothetical protein JNL08_18215 [Planctomycetes bacterium]|nr:hypothetical protein [Planctomycetota bacterium]